MDNLIKFLKEKITNKTHLEEIINAFEQMCNIPLKNIYAKENMILFETGTFTNLEGESFFTISLVRQFPDEDEEFYQIHVEISYKPDNENKIFSGSIWDEELNESIFEHIRNSKVFDYAKNKEYCEVKIWCDET